jgi:drug/metabolite transporter (DMT)-like permease
LVVAAVTWALYSVLGRIVSRTYPALITTGYATFFGAVFTAPLVPLEWGMTGPRWEAAPGLVWPGVLYLGVVSTAGAFYLWNKSIALLGPASWGNLLMALGFGGLHIGFGWIIARRYGG